MIKRLPERIMLPEVMKQLHPLLSASKRKMFYYFFVLKAKPGSFKVNLQTSISKFYSCDVIKSKVGSRYQVLISCTGTGKFRLAQKTLTRADMIDFVHSTIITRFHPIEPVLACGSRRVRILKAANLFIPFLNWKIEIELSARDQNLSICSLEWSVSLLKNYWSN